MVTKKHLAAVAPKVSLSGAHLALIPTWLPGVVGLTSWAPTASEGSFLMSVEGGAVLTQRNVEGQCWKLKPCVQPLPNPAYTAREVHTPEPAVAFHFRSLIPTYWAQSRALPKTWLSKPESGGGRASPWLLPAPLALPSTMRGRAQQPQMWGGAIVLSWPPPPPPLPNL